MRGYGVLSKGYVALTAALFAIISELGSVGLASRKPSTTPLSSSAVAQSQGLGASFITNVGACLDKDGDGYGVGPACLGPDADDNDSTVHSANDVVAKYGSINAFLTHLGYQSASSPLTVWCISPAGNNATGASSMNADTACTHPFQTWSGLVGVTNPYIVIFRAGTYGQQIYQPPSGTSSSQNVIMQYPGELAVIDGSRFNYGTAFRLDARSYITVDGFKVINVDSGAAYSGGTYCPLPCSGSVQFIGDVLRHMEGQSGGVDSNVDADNIQNFLLEESVFHDPDTSVGQHNVYLGSNSLASSNVTVRRNILYNDNTGYPSFQFNGRVTNLVLSQNMIYNSEGTGISLLQGVSNSFIESNLVFNTANESLKIFDYESGQCRVNGLPSICPYDQTGNLIENNTFWVGTSSPFGSKGNANTTFTPPGSGQLGGVTYGAISVQNATTSAGCGSRPAPCGNLGGNTFANNILVGSGPRFPGGSYPPITFPLTNPNYLSTSTFTNDVIWAQDGASGDNFVVGFGPGSSFGYQGFACAQFATLAKVSNCINADPLFVAASPNFFNTPASFNFHLQAASPAVGKGISTSFPLLDLTGNAWNSPPSIGALEAASTLSPRITSALTASGQVGSAFSYSITGTNTPTRFGANPLPAGVAVNTATGAITGTPTAPAATPITLTATNSGGTGSATLTLTITPVVAPTITSSLMAYGEVGSAFSYTISADNSPTSYRATGLPAFLSLNTATGTITGTPTAAATTNVTLSATNIAGSSQTAILKLTIVAPNTPVLGWTDLRNTELQITDSSGNPLADSSGKPLQNICPPNTAVYAFSANCHSVTGAWNGGVADTKRDRLIIWGGGHTDYFGNELYSLNLAPLLTNNPATLTRLNDPSPTALINNVTANSNGCPIALSDGNPNSRHTYNDLAYLAQADRMFTFTGGLACGNGAHANDTWTLDLNTLAWKRMDPTNGASLTCGTSQCLGSPLAQVAFDPNSKAVFMDWSDLLYRYVFETNTYTLLNNNAHTVFNGTGVIDPHRTLFIFLGTEYNDTAPHVKVIDISPGSNYVVQDWSGRVSGCDALAGSPYPGLAYDPVLDRIVGWPSAGNTVYIFNPDTKTCTAQTFSNGPPNVPAPINGNTSVFGRFRYFRDLNAYAVFSQWNLDAFLLRMNLTAPSSDVTPPTVAITRPTAGIVSGNTRVSASASDDVGIVGVLFKLDGANLGMEITTPPFSLTWNTTALTNGSHTMTAVARDAAGNTALAAPVTVTVSNKRDRHD